MPTHEMLPECQGAFNELRSTLKRVETSQAEMKSDVRLIKDNHVNHIELEMRDIASDTRWLKALILPVTLAIIGGLITIIFKVLT